MKTQTKNRLTSRTIPPLNSNGNGHNNGSGHNGAEGLKEKLDRRYQREDSGHPEFNSWRARTLEDFRRRYAEIWSGVLPESAATYDGLDRVTATDMKIGTLDKTGMLLYSYERELFQAAQFVPIPHGAHEVAVYELKQDVLHLLMFIVKSAWVSRVMALFPGATQESDFTVKSLWTVVATKSAPDGDHCRQIDITISSPLF